MSSDWLVVRPWEVSTVARIRQFSDDEHAMRVTCYLVCALVIAVSIGVVVYAFFLR